MSGNNRNNSRNNNNLGLWAGAAAIATGATALAGGIYWLSQRQNSNANTVQSSTNTQRLQGSYVNPGQTTVPESEPSSNISSYLSSFLNRMSVYSGVNQNNDVSTNDAIPLKPNITNLNSLLSDIYVRYVQIKADDFELHYKVFDSIFQHLHKKMKEVDLYYNRYSSTVQFAGSHFDNLRIKKPDEFDMDIVIGLPLNLNEDVGNPLDSDIVIESKDVGFVQLKMGVQYQRLPMRDGNEWQVNKTAYQWKDDSNYLAQDKFLSWFKSLVNRALLKFDHSLGLPYYYVAGVQYFILKSESGPAMTLIIENRTGGFKLDVDLVPALKFPETRWPIDGSYRAIPIGCKKDSFMVVGKPNKAAETRQERTRSWRLALHNQERELMHNSNNLRQAMRFIKKLRDTQGMKNIASYYLKTLFFWEIVERKDMSFWSKNNPATLFKIMVGRFHAALVKGEIPYFWHKNNNLIQHIDRATLTKYANKLVPLMILLENNEPYKHVAKYLLTPEEFRSYNSKYLHI